MFEFLERVLSENGIKMKQHEETSAACTSSRLLHLTSTKYLKNTN